MKAIEHCFSMVPFIMLCKVVLSFESMDEIQSVTIEMKAIEQYSAVVLFVILHKVVLTVTVAVQFSPFSISYLLLHCIFLITT